MNVFITIFRILMIRIPFNGLYGARPRPGSMSPPRAGCSRSPKVPPKNCSVKRKFKAPKPNNRATLEDRAKNRLKVENALHYHEVT